MRQAARGVGMFDKILIANRGEIACRIITTARRLGVRSVAVYSDADATARHVRMADEAVWIGPSPPAQSYLDAAAILRAALQTGAQAIHPGYGFLSENPEFVNAVEAEGLCFIGPSSEAVRSMGLKDAAKILMEQAGVPVVPGYHGADQGADVLARAARDIGYPVLIKAVAGGGGKGMRRVDRADDFAAALASARGEAATAFGNDAVLIEKRVPAPRHIEVQVFGDGDRAVHLFERDCSLQRRHQKVIEEAPAPGMIAKMRAVMGAAAVRAAQAIGYAGAGTVEFIVDGADGLDPDRFWFMEMNTRLQVEHPVTEAITGIDLVEWQLRVAAGEPLPVTQDELSITGHAFEARLYAEDVAAGFLPATGTLRHLKFAKAARVDTGVASGDVISPHYDPMIAKIITHGPTRDMALRQLAQALDATQVAGVVTNLDFLARLARHPGFGRGAADTGLIARDLDQLAATPAPAPRVIAQAALVAAGLIEGQDPLAGFTLWAPLVRSVGLVHQGETYALTLCARSDGAVLVDIDGLTVEAVRKGDVWMFDDMPARDYNQTGAQISVFSGTGYHFICPDPLDRRSTDPGMGRNALAAPMPGQVKMLMTNVGASVQQGDPLAVLEAMKMEHTLTAPRNGVVAEILVDEGDQVAAATPLIRLEEDAT